MATKSNRSIMAIVAAAIAVIALMIIYRVVSDSESAVTLDTLPPIPTTTTPPTTTSTTTTTVAPPPVVPLPPRSRDDDEDEEDEDTSTTVERDPVRGGRDQWGNQRYLDPETGDLVYLVDGLGERIELDDYEALRWGFFDQDGNWVLAADVLRGG